MVCGIGGGGVRFIAGEGVGGIISKPFVNCCNFARLQELVVWWLPEADSEGAGVCECGGIALV